MSEIKGCMNCGNISCGNNKKRESAGCGRYISPEDKIKELEKENAELKKEWQEQVQKATDEGYTRTLQTIQLTKTKELLKQWLQTSKASDCDNINIVTDTEQFLNSEVVK